MLLRGRKMRIEWRNTPKWRAKLADRLLRLSIKAAGGKAEPHVFID